MANSETLSANQGKVWIQTDGPNSQPRLLGCYEMGDVTVPLGEVVRTRCPDPAHPGKWLTTNTRRGPADYPSTSLSGLMGKTADYMEKATRNKICPMGLYVVWSSCGRADMFANYDVVKIVENAQVTSHGEGGLVSREGTDDTTLSWDIDAEKVEVIYPLVASQPLTAAAGGFLDIAAASDAKCTSGCGPSSDLCDVLYAVTEGAVAAKGELWRSADRGATWAVTASQPWAVNMNISSVVVFDVSRSVKRILVSNGTTDAGAAAKVAYSDDLGATWTLVSVGTTLADFFAWNGSLFALDMYHIWGVTNLGAVYFSSDGGVTWTLQTAAPAALINCVRFADANIGVLVGTANLIYYTEDGGAHWSIVTGPAAQAAVVARTVAVIDRYRWFVGYADGEIWYTNDGGTTWLQRTIPLPTGVTAIAAINDLGVWDEYVLFAGAHGTIGGAVKPVILRSYDGGYTWEGRIGGTMTAGGKGVEAIQVCGANSAFGVGDLTNAVGTTMSVSE